MKAIALTTVDSTNDEAKRRIRSGALCEPAYIVARHQTAGRGSRGRSWSSPKDAGIYLTVVELPRRELVATTTDFTLAAGVACVDALRAVTGVAVRLKPVNDLLARNGKLGGILTETVMYNGGVEAVIIGVGVNVRRAERRVTPDALPPVSLEDLLTAGEFRRLDLDALVAELVIRLRHGAAKVLAGATKDVREAWRASADRTGSKSPA